MKEMPSPFEFNHCILAVPQGEGFLFLDPAFPLIKCGMLSDTEQGVEAFIVTDEGYKFVITPESRAQDNIADTRTTIKIKRDGSADLVEKVKIFGIEEIALRVAGKYSTKMMNEKIFSEMLGSAYPGGGKLLEFEVNDVDNFDAPVKSTTHFLVNRFLQKVGTDFVINIPSQRILGFRNIIGGSYRKNPVWISYPYTEKDEYVIEIPQGYYVKYVPQDISLDLPFVAYSTSITNDKRKIYITQSTIMKTKVIPVGKFGQFKNMIEKIFSHSNEMIIISEKESP
jgi:hypothetical protein